MTETKIFIDPIHLPQHLKAHCGDFTTNYVDSENRAIVIDRHGKMLLTDGERFWEAKDTHGVISVEYCFDGPNSMKCYVTLRIKFTDGLLSGIETIFDEIIAPMCHIQERHQYHQYCVEKLQESADDFISILDSIFSGMIASSIDMKDRPRIH